MIANYWRSPYWIAFVLPTIDDFCRWFWAIFDVFRVGHGRVIYTFCLLVKASSVHYVNETLKIVLTKINEKFILRLSTAPKKRTKKENTNENEPQKASQSLRDWLNKTEKTTGLEKSIIVTGILMSYALKSREEEKSSTTKKTAAITMTELWKKPWSKNWSCSAGTSCNPV